MNEQIGIYVCIGGAVAATGFFVARSVLGKDDTKLRSRLHDDQRPTTINAAALNAAGDPTSPTADSAMKPMLKRISNAVAEPFMPTNRETQSAIRKKLNAAGIYSNGALRMMQGAKLVCLISGLLVGYISGMLLNNMLIGISLGGLIGYFAPKIWLGTHVKRNQKALTLGLPDALDLMVVCVEAGLTVDAAMQRVGQELVLAHPGISRELGMAHMETRIGLSRQEALRNLGTRTGNAPLQSLAAMLVQAERFGTSIANALRIHADSMRVKRQHAAEEMAAKASVKMSFPLVLFIFPATFIILAGPTVLGLMHSALFND